MHRSKLSSLAKKSELMNIGISYGKEKFHFNLYEELVIDENILNREIQNQSISYAFLVILSKKLTRHVADMEIELEKTGGKVWAKSKKDNPKLTKDDLRALVESNVKCKKLKEKINKRKEDLGIIVACVKAFEQRTDMIQTLSANTRKSI